MANSGEGSRGGKIIGHTKSGKPVYASGVGLAVYGVTSRNLTATAAGVAVIAHTKSITHLAKSKELFEAVRPNTFIARRATEEARLIIMKGYHNPEKTMMDLYRHGKGATPGGPYNTVRMLMDHSKALRKSAGKARGIRNIAAGVAVAGIAHAIIKKRTPQ